MTIIYILISTTVISLGSLAGIFTLSLKEKFLRKILLSLVALSSGAFLGDTFIHLIPEGIKKLNPDTFFLIVLASLITYLLIEKILHWHHCHDGKECDVHTLGYMSLIGDTFHNLIDGLIIAATFIVSIPLGITTTIAIAAHEIPQEISDLGVLLHAGLKKKKALLLNFGASLTVILGGIVGWKLSNNIESLTAYLLPIASGGFLYIALSDLLPELRKADMKKFLTSSIFLLVGIGAMYALTFLE